MKSDVSKELISATVQDVSGLLSGDLKGWCQVMLPVGHPYFPHKPRLDPSRDLDNQRLLFAWGLVPVECLGSDLKTVEIKYDDVVDSVPLSDVLISRYRGRFLEESPCSVSM